LQVSESEPETSLGTDKHLTELRFDDLPLIEPLKRGIREAGFTYCTPIQSQTLPEALAGHDVAGQAQTGTGKTAAFLIALLQRIASAPAPEARLPSPRALIVAPTRELAVQIHADATVLAKYLDIRLALVFGGTDYQKQERQLAAGIDLLIGTPGRLIDYFKQRVYSFDRVEVLVLDEADRMFDLGFIRDIRFILRRLPPREQRLNMLFSATLSYKVMELAHEHMNEPRLVRIEPDKKTVDRVRQVIYFPSNREKFPLLLTLLLKMDAKRTMIFVNTRRSADHLAQRLVEFGIQAEALSGDVPQPKRLSMLKRFLAGELAVLIATDVASRGLHVPDVSHVFNYDLPYDAEDYVHRIGRTARAGATGDAISFGCEDYVTSLPDIEQFIGRKIPVEAVDPSQFVSPDAARAATGAPTGHRGKRKPRPRSGSGKPRADQGSSE
jgi:ATP-dependent RNA helicase RhlB